jgi:hypothetical protein
MTTTIRAALLGAAALTASAADVHAQSNPWAAHNQAIFDIATHNLQVRTGEYLAQIEAHQNQAVAVLTSSEASGVGFSALIEAELDAEAALHETARLATLEIRGLAINTLTTLRTWGGDPAQIQGVAQAWAGHVATLDAAVHQAELAIESATIADAGVASGLLPIAGASGSALAAQGVAALEALSLEIANDIRAASDPALLEVNQPAMIYATKRDLRRALRDDNRALKVSYRDARRDLRGQWKQLFREVRRSGGSRADVIALREARKQAEQRIRLAMQDARFDLRFARTMGQ